MAKVKDFYATKTNRSKIYKALNFSASIAGYDDYENNFVIGCGNKFVSFDKFIIAECYGNDDVVFENHNNLLVLNSEYCEKIENANSKEEVFEILNNEMEFETNKDVLVSFLNEKYKKLDITNKELIFKLKFDKNIIKFIKDIMDENDDSYHSYPSFKVNEENKLKIDFQTKIIDYNENIDVENIRNKCFDIFLPFEFGKQYSKLDNLTYELYDNGKSNIALISFNYIGFNYKLLISVLKER